LKLYVDNGGVLLAAKAPEKAKQQTQTASKQDNNYISHKVKSGESLYSIASKYPGITAQDLRKANKLPNSKIMPGQVLKIPKG
jgi:membrane-bound lytic murein transglycosylase D